MQTSKCKTRIVVAIVLLILGWAKVKHQNEQDDALVQNALDFAEKMKVQLRKEHAQANQQHP